MPLVSWLIPARDAAATLPAALRGVLGQRDAPPSEIVCVDDGSHDDTRAVLEAARAHSPVPFTIVPGPAHGLVAALNEGLRHCRGAYVARMDADDEVHEDRLRLQCALLEADPTLAAVGSHVRLVPRPLTPGLDRLERWLDAHATKEELRRARFIEHPLVHPSATFRRAALDAVGGFQDHGWAEDWDLQLRLLHAGWELAKVPRTLLHWHDSPQRLTRTGSAYAAEQMIRLRAHHLATGPLRGRPWELWGAGPTGKRLARALEAHGLRPRRVLDIDPRKQVARGVRITPGAEVGPPGEAVLVCAVGAAGARETIRAALEPLGWVEGDHYLFAA